MHQLLAPVDHADLPLLNHARAICEKELRNEINGSIVRQLNQRSGIDEATAVLYAYFESKLLASEKPMLIADPLQRPLMLAIAPGAFYKEHPEVGADGRELVELAGQKSWDCELIPCESVGTLEVNARIINTFLERATQSHRVILVSLSKGAADARCALSRRPDLFDSMAAWVSVSGVSHGTMMADWLLDKWYLRPILYLMLWRHRTDGQPIRDLRYHPETTASGSFRKTNVPQFHIAAFPLEKHLSCRRARLWHRRFRNHGPNDGVVMLEDLLKLSGIVIPVWGADHYLQGPWDTSNLVSQLIALLGYDASKTDSVGNAASHPTPLTAGA